jgi:hypothetical protein
MLCPLRNRVGELFAYHALEDLAVLGSVEMAKQIVERAVLEQHEDDVVDGVRAVMSHWASPW